MTASPRMMPSTVLRRLAAALLVGLIFVSASAVAATPENEKAFLDAYRKALEAGDDKALATFCYLERGQEQNELLKSIYLLQSGDKVLKIELRAISEAETRKFNTPLEAPGGKSYLLNLKPTKLLVVETKNAGATVTNTLPVAEKNGKLVMPVAVVQTPNAKN